MEELGLGLDLGITHTGYRLSHFQVYNWGTFDNHIVNINLDGENTLLTGGNGSGKTTLVDALLTLIVPTNDRTYNLSSGHEGRSGRNEESYVLGAYSTEKGESDYTASKKTLRDKSCHSIILANFSNKTAVSSVTLMQIRYFSSNGSLRRQYFVIEGELSIEMLNEKNVGYNTSGNWIQELKKAFPELSITSYDTFKRYSHDFAKKFGFRYKDKAIKIFSQTVGMKDLYDLNSFIRDRMLDESDSYENFNIISKNYNNLMLLKNQIDKEELQIKMLEKIKDAHSSYQYFSTKKEKKEIIKDKYLPTWEDQTLLSILTKEIDEYSENLQTLEINIKNSKEEKDQLEDSINEIKQTLLSDEREKQIDYLSTRRRDLTTTVNLMQPQVDSYKKNLKVLHLDFPTSEPEFVKIKNNATSKISILENKLEKLEEDKNELISLKNIVSKNIETINTQLVAIEKKQSNIPLEYLEIRDDILRETNLDVEDIPFFGELVRVQDIALDKSLALESLIRPIALSIVVLPQHAIKIANYLYEKELDKTIKIIIVEDVNTCLLENGDDRDQLNIFDDTDEIIFEEDSCPTFSNLMLEVKEDYEYRAFIETFLSKHFNHAFSSNKEIVLSADNTFGETSLLNINNTFIKALTNEELDLHILGWETEKKILRLKEKVADLNNQLKTFEKDILNQISLINKTTKQLTSFIYFSEVEDYSAINISKHTVQIENIDAQLLELKNASSDLEELKNDLAAKNSRRQELEYLIGNLNQQIGATQSALSIKEARKKRVDENLFNQDLSSLFEPISQMQTEYNIPKAFSGVEEVSYYKTKIEDKVYNEIKYFDEELNKVKKELYTKINQFKNPSSSITLEYPSWASDTSDLPDGIEEIELFERLLNKLQTDSLPKYKEQFSNLRTRQIQQDIIDLNSSLKDWNRKIKENIFDLNESLNSIEYQKEAKTKIRLTIETVRDKEIRKFKNILDKAIPDPGIAALGKDEQQKANEKFILAVDDLVNTLKNNDRFAKKVLDVRNWYQFAVEEYNYETLEQIRFYKDSGAISGGQKAKLAYTILAAAIAHQFDVFNFDNSARSFRFVIVDEAFSKSDDTNSRYAMDLFKTMDLQLMVVTPMDKVNLVEPYIKSVQITICEDGKHSFVHSIKKEELENVNKGNN